jgi:hypothetical protein
MHSPTKFKPEDGNSMFLQNINSTAILYSATAQKTTVYNTAIKLENLNTIMMIMHAFINMKISRNNPYISEIMN